MINQQSPVPPEPRRTVIVFLVLLIIFLLGLLLVVIADKYLTNEFWKLLFNILGGFMAISVAASVIYQFTMKRTDDAKRRDELKSILEEIVDCHLPNSQEYGLAGFVGQLDFKDMFQEMLAGDCLLWLDTYAPGYVHWIEEMKSALRKNCKMKMLILDPSSENAVFRSEELPDRYTYDVFKQELSDFLREMRSLACKEEFSNLLEVATYKDLPGIPMYIIVRDGVPIRAYSSLFLTRATGVDYPHFVWEYTQNGIIQGMQDHFMAKWTRATQKD